MDDQSRTRLIRTANWAEAECLTVAFFRFVELHGRLVSDPKHHCSIQTVISSGLNRAPTRIVTLWSARAATEF